MEIKVTCPCGTRYKFPVEPVDGRLPQAIACPVCGADNTELGNQMIQEQLSGSVTPPPPPPAGGLRIAAHTPAAPSPAAAPPPPRPQPIMGGAARSAPAGEGAMAKTKKILTTILTIILVLIGIYAFYRKWSRRIGGMASLIEAVSSSGDSADSGKKVRWTLPDDNGSELLVKSDSQTNVAATLATVYSQIAKRPMRVVPNADELDADAQFGVMPVLKGVVQVGGPAEWQEAQATNLAATVSKQLHTTVVLAIMGDDAETGTVSIYEDGERRFYVHHWMEIKSLTEDGIKEFTQRDGDAWAAAHGYVPGPTNAASGDKMAFEDVNQLVLNLGIDVSDPPEEITGTLVVKATGPAGAARPAAGRK